ncbi:MAG: hypothetical protein VR70_05355 [Rhodospirillaceae bacterium BRH_c57]|nr:MAG: hypothetical protein VR70_06200 [Rhodospirillaceae bacterium BRH_c57]KJS41176.1 MAG: hypothetical protein VR70_05355 [Rhodospirillaceae bacterium BRH_c57]
MKKAWIENDRVRDVCPGDPAALYHPAVAAYYTTDVPDNAANGDGWVDGALVKPPVPEPAAPVEPVITYQTKLSRPEFKLQFTAPERLAIRAARAYTGTEAAQVNLKAALDDFFDLIEDPALTAIDLELPATVEGVTFLATAGLIAAERVPVILAGLPE